MEKLRVLDLFSGIGGFSLGLERTGGFETVAFCEIEEFPRRVLAKHWPGVPIYDDVRTLTGERLAADGIAVDVICGGFPCQDISKGGFGAGLGGARSGLWADYARLIHEVRPRWVLIENVPELRARGLEQVLGQLDAIGYDAEWHCVAAAHVGAPTRRDRLWVISYPRGARVEGLFQDVAFGDAGSWEWRGHEDLLAVADAAFEPCPRWPQPMLRRVDARVPNRMVRLKALGNAVVPQIPELIGRAILTARQDTARAA